jgi:hypothetical protein
MVQEPDDADDPGSSPAPPVGCGSALVVVFVIAFLAWLVWVVFLAPEPPINA